METVAEAFEVALRKTAFIRATRPAAPIPSASSGSGRYIPSCADGIKKSVWGANDPSANQLIEIVTRKHVRGGTFANHERIESSIGDVAHLDIAAAKEHTVKVSLRQGSKCGRVEASRSS